MDTELDLLGERIAEQAAHLDAAMYRLLMDLREFDERGGWYAQGALSCAHWLSWRVGWTLATARDHGRVASKLPEVPAISDALRRGEVSYSKVRAMLRIATPANEALLLDYARLMTASQLEETCRKYALVLRHGQDPHPLGDLQRRYVRRRNTEDGMVKIEAVLHPEEAELIWTMLTHAATQLTHTPAPHTRQVSDSNSESPSHHVSAETSDANTESSSGPVSAETSDANTESSSGPVSAETSDANAESSSGPVSAETSDANAEPASLLDHLLDNAEMLRAAEALPDHNAEAEAEVRPRKHVGVLQQRADAVRRAFSRADALVAVAQGYLRGDRPNRAPIEVTLKIPASGLRTAAPQCGAPLPRGAGLKGRDGFERSNGLVCGDGFERSNGLACGGGFEHGDGFERGEGDHGDGLHPVEVGEMGESFVSCEAARRLSCDCGVVEVIEDDHGVPLSVGRKRRTISGQLKRALIQRDKTCTFPGCTNRLFLEGHHIKHWADGGETSLGNAALLCTTHHHHVHEYGYTVELDSDQRPRFRDPHGRVVVAVPERPTVAELGWPSIRAAHEALGISAETNACKWDGNPVDYGAVIGYLVAADGLN